MKRFAGIAAIAFAAHAGMAVAQPVIISPDEGPRGRMERPPGGAEPRGARGVEGEAPQRQPDGSSRSQRGAQMEERRGQDQQRGQDLRERGQERQQRAQEQRTHGQEREQSQRAQDQQRGQDKQRAQDQRTQSQQQREQAQREQQGQRTPAQQNAQPQQPDERTNRPSTAQPNQPSPDDRQRATSPAPAPSTGAPQTGTAAGQPAATAPQSAQGQAGSADTQRIADTVRQGIDRKEIRPVSNLGVAVSVGVELPSRVQLQPLPREIATIRPQYRDYRYTVSDREIVIVDPRSRRVVEVIARDGRGGDADIYASFTHRRDIRRWNRPDTVVFRQGVVLPPSAYYYDLPVEVVERHPDWRGYQYVMTESEEVAIVEPRSRRIVEVVDKGATQSAAAAPATTGSTPPPASMDDRHQIARIILGDARPGDIQGIDGLKGAVLPNEMALHPLPREAEERDSGLRGYQYTLIGDDVLIVDPQTRRIIDVIE